MRIRNLPCNTEAEAIVIGSLILDFQAQYRNAVREMLCPADFFMPQNIAVFQSIINMLDAKLPIELPSLSDYMRKMGTLKDNGDDDYLNMLAEGVPSIASTMYYAGIVKQAADARQVIAIARKLADDAYNTLESPYACAADAVAQLTEIQPHGIDPRFTTLAKTVDSAATEAIAAHDGQRPANLTTGFHDIDYATSGFAPGELIVVAADTSLGKTSLCLGLVIDLADKSGTTFYVSAEMPIAQIGKRIIQAKGNINASRLRSGKDLTLDDITKIEIVRGETEKWTGYVWAKNPTVPQLAAKIEQAERKNGRKIDLIVIDYLQLLKPTGGQNRAQQVAGIANDLKSLAVEKATPIVLVSQFNRAGATNNGCPTIHDLKECVTGDTRIHCASTGAMKPITDVLSGDYVWAVNQEQKLVKARVKKVWCSGIKPTRKVITRTGRRIVCTDNQPFLTPDGWKPLSELNKNDRIATAFSIPQITGMSNINWESIRNIENNGDEKTYDIEVEGHHNYLADGIVVHNSGDIENAADVIILLHKPKTPEFDITGRWEKIWLRIAKARDGRTTLWTGDHALRLWWNPTNTNFFNVAMDKENYNGY